MRLNPFRPSVEADLAEIATTSEHLINSDLENNIYWQFREGQSVELKYMILALVKSELDNTSR